MPTMTIAEMHAKAERFTTELMVGQQLSSSPKTPSSRDWNDDAGGSFSPSTSTPTPKKKAAPKKKNEKKESQEERQAQIKAEALAYAFSDLTSKKQAAALEEKRYAWIRAEALTNAYSDLTKKQAAALLVSKGRPTKKQKFTFKGEIPTAEQTYTCCTKNCSNQEILFLESNLNQGSYRNFCEDCQVVCGLPDNTQVASSDTVADPRTTDAALSLADPRNAGPHTPSSDMVAVVEDPEPIFLQNVDCYVSGLLASFWRTTLNKMVHEVLFFVSTKWICNRKGKTNTTSALWGETWPDRMYLYHIWVEAYQRSALYPWW